MDRVVPKNASAKMAIATIFLENVDVIQVGRVPFAKIRVLVESMDTSVNLNVVVKMVVCAITNLVNAFANLDGLGQFVLIGVNLVIGGLAVTILAIVTMELRVTT